ncbi:hypothetical protein [Paenibacillus faecis]|uniref:hypothetical protein n=1 Tax=Paenibacillus faecis TaxID=862114 RepID=UPI001BD0D3AB|nr:hypothetical protein [Paenibacillus faecis]
MDMERNLNDNQQDREIEELKRRLNLAEQQLAQRPKAQLPRAVKFGIAFLVGLFLLLTLVGVIQFISAG